jgi:hypothetical protein
MPCGDWRVRLLHAGAHADSDSFNRLHAEQLLYLPGVRQIRSFMVLKQVLSTTQFPI